MVRKLPISERVAIPLDEVELSAVRAQGPGGQNVNKVASAVQLRFNSCASSLPDFYKARLLKLSDRRISRDGVVLIKAQRYRSQEQNRADALSRLQALVRRAGTTAKARVPTRPGRAAREKRLEDKKQRSRTKALRKRP